MDVSVVPGCSKLTSKMNSPRPKFASFDHSVASGCHELFSSSLTYDSKKVYDFHNFIFGLLTVTVRKTSFVFVLQMQLF